MNRIFKIAEEFLESVDQRADRSVNSTTQTPIYKTRVVETRTQQPLSVNTPTRVRDRYVPKNPRTTNSTGSQRRLMSPSSRRSPMYNTDTKKTDQEIAAIMNSLTAEEPQHKRSASEQFSIFEEAKPQYTNRVISTTELSPSDMKEEEPAAEKHTWGEDENEVGLHITESVDPNLCLSPGNLSMVALADKELDTEYTDTTDVSELQNHINDLEHDLDEALAQVDSHVRALEDKDIRIDILENRLKQMRIDNDRTKEKTDVLIDEKDALIIKLQTENESLKADYYHLKLECNEEKERAQKNVLQAEKEADGIQIQLKQLEDLNNDLKNQLLQLSESSRLDDEKARGLLKEKDAQIAELTNNLASAQKQVEDYIMRIDNPDEKGEEAEKIMYLEKELMKLRLEKDKWIRENASVVESSQKTIEEYRNLVKQYEEQLSEKDSQIKKYQKQEEIMKLNKENSYSLLQNQIEQLQQTVLKKQLLLDAVNSEKSSLEYRLADLLRDKARAESLRRLGSNQREEWCDVEVGETEEKTHTRSIAKIFPDATPSIVLEKVDQVDAVSLSVVQFLRRSPSFRLLFIMYFLSLHFILLIWFFKKSCVFFKQINLNNTYLPRVIPNK